MEAEELYGVLLKTIQETLEGAGAIRGVPCELENIEEQEDAFILEFKWEERDGSVHRQDMLIPKPQDTSSQYDYDEIVVGGWVNGEPIYRKVVEITDGIAKDNLIKVCDRPSHMGILIKGSAIVETQFGSYSNDDVLVYSDTNGVYIKQNFTSYPQKLYVIIEYTKVIN